MHRRARNAVLIIPLAVVLGSAVTAPAITATAGTTSDFTVSKGFRKAMTVAGVREHQAAFQAIADANGGIRAAGSAGDAASADYVVDRLEDAGYDVTLQPFDFLYNADQSPPVVQKIAPNAVNYVNGVDFFSMAYSGNGDVTAPVYAVDIAISAVPNTSTSGCEAADFAGFPAGNIALVQRGTCTFGIKASNAHAAGALAVVVFNEGQPGRTAAVNGTLGGPDIFPLPVVGATFALGDDWRNGVLNGPTGTVGKVRVDRVVEQRTTNNVIAETAGGDPDHVVVVGAHLDSVPAGPGINDNGSGSATILEIAEVYAAQARTPVSKVRFAWWGAEESGLIGSSYYVSQLSTEELDAIELNLNFDMVGSPNYVRFVYDGDNSRGGGAVGPAGSAAIEQTFHDYFASAGLASAETPFSGRSDYGPFIDVGIPAGGLFTGAEGVKTAAEAAVFGGTAGVAYDPCYHLACDTYANNSNPAINEMSDAAAHTVLTYSRRNFDKSPLVDPGGPVSGSFLTGTSSGGLHDDHDVVAR